MTADRSEDMFNSAEFQRFLQNNTSSSTFLNRTNSDIFKSREALADIFKSKDSFADIFKSKDSFSSLFQSMDNNNNSQQAAETNADMFRSREWKNLGQHVDVSISSEIFDCGECQQKHPTHEQEAAAARLPEPSKTNWGDFFYAQLHPPAEEPAVVEEPAPRIPSPRVAAVAVAPAPASVVPKAKRSSSKRGGPKRTNTKGRKGSAATSSGKAYVHPTDVDVLLGRGGKSNHHPGNKRYREEIKNFQTSYAQLHSKEDKTDLSRYVVDYVHQYNGRFLALDKDVRPNRWYEVTDVVARRKVSQALREDDDPVKRKEKRARFLERKKQKQLQED